MTLADFTPCPSCTTPDTCGMVGRRLDRGVDPGSTHPRAAVLREAERAVMRDRAATHGEAEDTFGHIARVWSARLGVTVTPEQVCILMQDLKGARAWANPQHMDNWTDAAGYAACGWGLVAK